MGAYDFMWNAVQSGQIGDLKEEVQELREKVDILKQWVDYLNSELEKVKANDQTN